MVLAHVWGLFRNPEQEWQRIHERGYSVGAVYLSHTLLFAAMPALAAYIGTTQIGWQIGAGDPVKLTQDSAMLIAAAYFFAMISGVFAVGYMIRWMSVTYCTTGVKSLNICVALASYTATPLFLVGLMQLFPILWLNMLMGLPALGYTVFLFYTGVPAMLDTSKERGFLFATAVMGFGLVALVALLAITVLLWGSGFEPQFTN